MNKTFWDNLPRPFFILAPMYDVTDAAFRRMIAKYSKGGDIPSPLTPLPEGERGTGKPLVDGGADYVTFTEFVSADGLCHPTGRERLIHHLWYSEIERPIVAQIFGATPANFTKAAQLCAELGFDGIDINMGCPVKNVQSQNACAALIKDPALAQDIVQATKEGAGDLPVSVKTRIGYTKVEIDTWIPALLETDPAVLTLHLRTKKEMSEVPAHWELMGDIMALRDAHTQAGNREVPIVGNGDVRDLADARAKAAEHGCDGVMLGRAVFGNPWLFREQHTTGDDLYPDIGEKLRVMVEHTQLFEELFAGIKNFAIMKKHYKAYAAGFPDAGVLRAKLMEAEDAAEVGQIVERWIGKSE